MEKSVKKSIVLQVLEDNNEMEKLVAALSPIISMFGLQLSIKLEQSSEDANILREAIIKAAYHNLQYMDAKINTMHMKECIENFDNLKVKSIQYNKATDELSIQMYDANDAGKLIDTDMFLSCVRTLYTHDTTVSFTV